MKNVALAFVFGALAVQAQEYTGTRGPVLITKCAPVYSEEARRAKLEGTVVMNIEVGTDGLAHSVTVKRLLGKGLDESAVDGVKQWRFKPGEKRGELVATPAVIEVIFRLNDMSKPCRAEVPGAAEAPNGGRV